MFHHVILSDFLLPLSNCGGGFKCHPVNSNPFSCYMILAFEIRHERAHSFLSCVNTDGTSARCLVSKRMLKEQRCKMGRGCDCEASDCVCETSASLFSLPFFHISRSQPTNATFFQCFWPLVRRTRLHDSEEKNSVLDQKLTATCFHHPTVPPFIFFCFVLFLRFMQLRETCDHPAAAVAQPVFYSTQGASSFTSPDGARG